MKRYTLWNDQMVEDIDGEWVKYDDAEQYALEEYQTGVNNGTNQCLGLG